MGTHNHLKALKEVGWAHGSEEVFVMKMERRSPAVDMQGENRFKGL